MTRRSPSGALLALLLAAACGSPEGEGVQSLEGVADTLAGDSAAMVSRVEDSALTAPDDSATDPALLTVGEEAPESWTSGPVSSGSTVRGGAILTAVRTGRHPDYERVVLELSDEGLGIPTYHVEYVDRPLRECGSGEQIHPPGDGWLEIRLEPADAHTPEGEPTVPHDPVDTPELQNMLRIYVTCDFEAVTTLVIAVRSPNRFRAFHLEAPRRIVVDIQK